MRFGHLLTAALIQLIVLFLPLAAGLVGLISGGIAGLTAILGWFVLGIPLSYAAMDALANRHARARERPEIAAAPAIGVPTTAS